MTTYIHPILWRAVHLGIGRRPSGDWYAYYEIPYLGERYEEPARTRAEALSIKRKSARIAWRRGYISLPLLSLLAGALAGKIASLLYLLYLR